MRERLDGLAAGRVAARVDDAAAVVAALARDVEVALRVEIEGDVHFDELAHIVRSLGNEDLDGGLVAESRARDHRVLKVVFRIVQRRNGRGNAALRKPRIADLRVFLREDAAGMSLVYVQRGVKAGNARADDQNIIV